MKKQDKKLLAFIFVLAAFLRVLTLVAAYTGLKTLPFKHSFPYVDAVLEKYGSPLFWSWANFDGVHYLMIAREGYIFGLTQAFFPLFILLVRFSGKIVKNPLAAGLLLNHLFFAVNLYVFYKLIRLDFKKEVGLWTLIFLSFFPTSFFFLSLYTESLFLLLVFSSFYLWRKKRHFMAGLVGALASATRITGIFLVPAFLHEARKSEKSQISKYLSAFLPSIGLLGYMWYLKSRFGDPFLFAHVQEGFGGGRQTDRLILLYQVFWRYFKMVLTVERNNPLYFTVWLETGSTALFLALLFFAYFKKVRKSYLIFAGLAYFLPTLTGTFSSMPRYVLGLFPGFIALALIEKRAFRLAWLALSLFLLFVCTAMFTRGYWVA